MLELITLTFAMESNAELKNQIWKDIDEYLKKIETQDKDLFQKATLLAEKHLREEKSSNIKALQSLSRKIQEIYLDTINEKLLQIKKKSIEAGQEIDRRDEQRRRLEEENQQLRQLGSEESKGDRPNMQFPTDPFATQALYSTLDTKRKQLNESRRKRLELEEREVKLKGTIEKELRDRKTRLNETQSDLNKTKENLERFRNLSRDKIRPYEEEDLEGMKDRIKDTRHRKRDILKFGENAQRTEARANRVKEIDEEIALLESEIRVEKTKEKPDQSRIDRKTKRIDYLTTEHKAITS